MRAGLPRVALVTVPVVVLLGMASGLLSNSGYDNRWFAALAKPSFLPPGWAFPVAWTILYVLQALALAIVWQARGAAGRGAAAGMFALQLALNLAWSPLFFVAHQVRAALWLIAAIFVTALITASLFARIRRVAGWLMAPYLAWLLFAAALNYRIDAMNPGAATLAPTGANTQITLLTTRFA